MASSNSSKSSSSNTINTGDQGRRDKNLAQKPLPNYGYPAPSAPRAQ